MRFKSPNNIDQSALQWSTTALGSAFIVSSSHGYLLQVGLAGSAKAGLESLQPWLHGLLPRWQALLIMENAETIGLADGSEVTLLTALYATACELASHKVLSDPTVQKGFILYKTSRANNMPSRRNSTANFAQPSLASHTGACGEEAIYKAVQ